MWVRNIAICLAFGAAATACGGSSSPASQKPEPAATVDRSQPRPAESAQTPTEDLAFIDSTIEIDGLDELAVVAGEDVVLDYLVHNREATERSVLLRVLRASEWIDPDLSVSSLRLEAESTVHLTADVSIPSTASVGDVFSYEVHAARSDDTSQRSSITVELTVIDTDTERPDVAPNQASTTTSKKVLIYVIGNDTGAGLDFSTLRQVGGGFRAADVSAADNGFVTYEPYENLIGRDMVLYEMCNRDGLCDTAPVTVIVNKA